MEAAGIFSLPTFGCVGQSRERSCPCDVSNRGVPSGRRGPRAETERLVFGGCAVGGSAVSAKPAGGGPGERDLGGTTQPQTRATRGHPKGCEAARLDTDAHHPISLQGARKDRGPRCSCWSSAPCPEARMPPPGFLGGFQAPCPPLPGDPHCVGRAISQRDARRRRTFPAV